MNFSMKDFFSKCDQIRMFVRTWSHLLEKSSMGNSIFCAVYILLFILCKYPWKGLQLYLKKSLAQVISCEFWEISKNTFFLQNISGGGFCIIINTWK